MAGWGVAIGVDSDAVAVSTPVVTVASMDASTSAVALAAATAVAAMSCVCVGLDEGVAVDVGSGSLSAQASVKTARFASSNSASTRITPPKCRTVCHATKPGASPKTRERSLPAGRRSANLHWPMVDLEQPRGFRLVSGFGVPTAT